MPLDEGAVNVVMADAVARHGAGLPVMGANGHSRLRQLMFGQHDRAVVAQPCGAC